LAWTKKRGETKDGRGRYLVSWRDPSGRHRGRTIIGRNEALAFKREVESALVASTYVDPRAGKVKVGEYAARWIDSNPRLGDRTRERYRQLLRTHVGPALGDVPVNRVRPTDVEALVTRVLGAGRSPGTARKVRNLISAVFRSAVRDGLVGRSPVEGVAIPPEGREEQRFLSAEQVDLLASTPLSIPGTGPSSTSARTGASGFGELAGLKINRLRILERRVDVVWQVTEEGGRLYEGAPKWGSARTVTIPAAVAEVLARHVAAYPPGPEGFVFTMREGGPLRRNNWVRDVWRPAIRRAGLEPLRPHDLRHTAAALAVEVGAHPKAIQELMGHRSITTTLNTYGHLFPALHDDLAGRLDGTFRRATAHNLRTTAAREVVPIRVAEGESGR
jgi:integrase